MEVIDVKIDMEENYLYVYYRKDNSHLMSNPPPPPTFFRKKYKFDNLQDLGVEYAKVKQSDFEVIWPD